MAANISGWDPNLNIPIPSPSPPSAPHYEKFEMATDSHRAPRLFLFHSILWPLSWLLRREKLGTSAVICRLPTQGTVADRNWLFSIMLITPPLYDMKLRVTEQRP